MEMNGLVLVWYHSHDSPPAFEPISLPEVNEGQWVYQGRNEYEVSCHIQDIPENGADIGHLDAVHSSPIFLGGEPSTWLKSLCQPWAWHHWGMQWTPLSNPTPHLAKVCLKHQLNIAGSNIHLFPLKVCQMSSRY